MTWPNKITYTRILLVPGFIIAALKVNEYPVFRYVTIAVFAVIAVGDALDGYIARRFNLSTREGKFIDPLADKLIMMAACVMLALPIWGLPDEGAPLRSEVAIIVVTRDVLICIWVVVAYLAGEKRIFEPTKLGRFTTFTQMLMIAAALVGTISPQVLGYGAAPLSFLAAFLTISSGSQYLYRYAKGRGFQATSPMSGGKGA